MSLDLADALGIALDHGCSLAELEDTLLARGETDDEIAAAWLYAWAYDAVRPPRDDLAARITNRAVRDKCGDIDGGRIEQRLKSCRAIQWLGCDSRNGAICRCAHILEQPVGHGCSVLPIRQRASPRSAISPSSASGRDPLALAPLVAARARSITESTSVSILVRRSISEATAPRRCQRRGAVRTLVSAVARLRSSTSSSLCPSDRLASSQSLGAGRR